MSEKANLSRREFVCHLKRPNPRPGSNVEYLLRILERRAVKAVEQHDQHLMLEV